MLYVWAAQMLLLQKTLMNVIYEQCSNILIFYQDSFMYCQIREHLLVLTISLVTKVQLASIWMLTKSHEDELVVQNKGISNTVTSVNLWLLNAGEVPFLIHCIVNYIRIMKNQLKHQELIAKHTHQVRLIVPPSSVTKSRKLRMIIIK